MPVRGHATLGVIMGLALAIGQVGQAASPTTQPFEGGVRQLEEARFDEALRSFELAAAQDPTDAQAVFFAGVVLNRLGRADEALARLKRAREMGSSHPR